MKKKVILAWGGGKDSALTLHELQRNGNFKIMALLTTITKDYDRITMHGIRRILLEYQAESLGIPLEKVFISENTSNEEYENEMKKVLEKYKDKGVSSVVFGDIIMDDVRRYREENLSNIGMKGIFPLWKKDTRYLANLFVDLGFRAVITCIDSNYLDKTFVGRDFNKDYLSILPPKIDPCGENGEFHSFVYDGPIFKKRISFKTGEIVLRKNRFYFCDLIPLP